MFSIDMYSRYVVKEQAKLKSDLSFKAIDGIDNILANIKNKYSFLNIIKDINIDDLTADNISKIIEVNVMDENYFFTAFRGIERFNQGSRIPPILVWHINFGEFFIPLQREQVGSKTTSRFLSKLKYNYDEEFPYTIEAKLVFNLNTEKFTLR